MTLFDIRFANDSIFERICKGFQLAAMVGFASAGSRFSTNISGENIWAFRSLSILLAGSRFMLAIQYTINIYLIREKMPNSVRGMYMIVGVLAACGFAYLGVSMTDHIAIHGIYLIDSPKQLFFTFGTTEPHVWTAWFPLFLGESLGVMGISSRTPRLGLEDTHLNVRMGLLTLIIIGEGVISVTRIVNKMVAPGGWTMWSFVHILGVTTTVVR